MQADKNVFFIDVYLCFPNPDVRQPSSSVFRLLQKKQKNTPAADIPIRQKLNDGNYRTRQDHIQTNNKLFMFYLQKLHLEDTNKNKYQFAVLWKII